MDSDNPPAYRFEMLGTFRVHLGSALIDRFQTQKTASLLAYLAYYPAQRHTREGLVDLLWPEAEPDVGRNRLSQALTWIRRQLEAADSPDAPALEAGRLHVQLSLNRTEVDAHRFDAATRAASDEDNSGLRRAIGIYRGVLLPDLYDNWALQERERLAIAYRAAVQRVIVTLELAGSIDGAIELARRAIGYDPHAEAHYFELMRLLSASGRSNEALQQYQILQSVLARKLETVPSPKTRLLADSIRADASAATAAPSDRTETASASELRPRPARQSAIPAQFTRFFGREAEIEATVALVNENQERLITLTGTGGAGKTRLACEIARQVAVEARYRVAFTSLSELTAGRQIAVAIVTDLGLRASPNISSLDQIVEEFAPDRVLLALDNVEHLADDPETISTIRELLERIPGLTILATSRQRIGIDGEREVAVSPLPAPSVGSDGATVAEDQLACASVDLFVDRARAVRPDFRLGAENAIIVARLCERLEGIPLAIELCAAWAQTLTPTQMIEKLGRRFDLLVSRRKDINARHRTLRSAIEYGYLQLPDDLKRVFVRLALFRGGWNLGAAEAYLSQGGDARNEFRVLDALTELRERSLIFVVENPSTIEGSGMRYRMLESLREFAVEVFTFAEEQTWRERHALYFLDLVETAERQWTGSEQGRWLATLEAEHDNIRAAMHWALEFGRRELAIHLTGALRLFWQTRGYLREGREWLVRALESDGSADGVADAVPVAAIAKAWTAFGHLAWSRGDFDEAQSAHETALALRRTIGDPIAVSESLYHLGITAFRQDRTSEARALFDESLGLAEAAADPSGISRIQLMYGNMALNDKDLDAARGYYERSLAIERSLSNRQRSADALNNLGLVARLQRDYGRATEAFHDVLAIRRELTDDFGAAIASVNLGATLRRQGNLPAAQATLIEGVRYAAGSGQKYILAHGLIELALIAVATGAFETAVTVIAAGVRLYASIGSAFTDEERADYETGLDVARASLGGPSYGTAWERGLGLPLTEAISLATDVERNTVSAGLN